MNAAYEAQAVRVEDFGTVDIHGGRFFSAKGRIVFSAIEGTLAIRGGFYNELSEETFRKQVETYCIPPYHTLPTTPDEQATYGAEYVWKVDSHPADPHATVHIACIEGSSDVQISVSKPQIICIINAQGNEIWQQKMHPDQPQSLSLLPGIYTLIGAYEQIEMHLHSSEESSIFAKFQKQ
jgi:hypothetical protein